MLGGARIVRLVVLQESKITASATAPPAPQNKLSRLPWIHGVSLEPHTNGEYAQKQKIVTTHFFGCFLSRPSNFAYPGAALRSGAILCRRFTRKSFENAIELRERLKARRERDFANAQITVSQEIARVLKSGARDILNESYPSHLLKFFAEIVRADVHGFRCFAQRNFFV